MHNKTLRSFFLFVAAALLLALVLPVFAQDAVEPAVSVSDQVVLDGTVTIDSASYAEPGFVVIHIDNGEGAPGPVIGYRQLSPGTNTNFTIPVDAAQATGTLFAMLHADTGEVGVYEFGTVEGADGPVADAAGNVVTPSFAVAVLNAKDQLIDGDTYTAASVTVSEPGWLVIHSDNEGAPGPVLGQTQLEPGTTADVAVELAAEGRTETLWPMLHVDTGEAGVYEFGTVEGADGPVVLGDVVATAQVFTVPHLRVDPQVVTGGDGMAMGDMAPSVTVKSALLAEPGFVVIHQEQDGAPGPVAGVSDPLPAGLSENVVIELDPALVTPNLWPMLHVDTGEAGVYEFGTVEGADGPVSVGDQVVTFGIAAAPSISYDGVTRLSDTEILIDQVVIDAPGWVVIHIDENGGPGPVAGQAALLPGVNRNVVITVDPAVLTTEQVFPMLHYDTGAAGVYEFGTVEGADGPVRVGDAVVTGPATPVVAE
ncbi:MAG: hypothetical protein SF029_19690 [bacterium]|nr:hypothetical protein [bacterium]